MLELVFWLIAFYILFKAIRIFLKYFMPALKNQNPDTHRPKTQSKYKDAEEVDFVEIKDDKKNGKEKS